MINKKLALIFCIFVSFENVFAPSLDDPSPEIETIYLPPHKKTGRAPIEGSLLREPVIGSLSPNNYWSQAHRTEEELNTFQSGYKPIGYTDVEPISKREAQTFYTSPELDRAKANFDKKQSAQAKRMKRNKKSKQKSRDRMVDSRALEAEHLDATARLVYQRNIEMRKILKQMADERAEIDRKALQKVRVDQTAGRTQIEDDQQAERDKIFTDFQAGLQKSPEKTDDEIKFEQVKRFSPQRKMSSRDSVSNKPQFNNTPTRLSPLTSQPNSLSSSPHSLAPISNRRRLNPSIDPKIAAQLRAAEKMMREREAAAKVEEADQSDKN